MQVINPLNNGRAATGFTSDDQVVLEYFADNAASAIERAMMTREIILRMIKMCGLRDPKETAVHANRLGAYAGEVYYKWALNQGISEDEIKRTKDLIRIGAMLHDLGNVAISDLILKKLEKLNSGRCNCIQFTGPVYFKTGNPN